MRKRLAKTLIITGIVCVIAALSLFIYNKTASDNAARFAAEAVAGLQRITVTDDAAVPVNNDVGMIFFQVFTIAQSILRHYPVHIRKAFKQQSSVFK